MKRLVFLAPTIEEAKLVVESLQAMKIEDEWMHVVASDQHLLETEHLHPATEMETTDVARDMDLGIVAGGTVGLLAGLAAVGLGPLGLALGGGTILAGSLLGIGLGGWLGKMIGERTPSEQMERYKSALEEGQILMMVDVPSERLPEAFSLIRKHCPQALVEAISLTHDHQIAA